MYMAVMSIVLKGILKTKMMFSKLLTETTKNKDEGIKKLIT